MKNRVRWVCAIASAALLCGCGRFAGETKDARPEALNRHETAMPYAYVAATVPSGVVAINGYTLANEKTISVGRKPLGIAASPNGSWIATANHDGGTVSIIDTKSKAVAAELQAKPKSIQLAFHPNGDSLWIVNQGAKEVQVNTVGGEWPVLERIAVGEAPFSLRFSRDGRFCFVSSRDGAHIINASTRKLLRTAATKDGTFQIQCSPDARRLYVSNSRLGSVFVVDVASAKIRKTIDTNRSPEYMALTSDGRTLFIANESGGSVTALDCETLEVTATIPVGNRPLEMALDAAERRLFVCNYNAGTLSVIDVDRKAVIKTVRVGERPYNVKRWPGRPYVITANHTAESCSLVSTETLEVVATIPTPKYGASIAFGK